MLHTCAISFLEFIQVWQLKKMQTCLLTSCFRQFTTLNCNNLTKKRKILLPIFNAIIDDFKRVLEQQITWYQIHLIMGRLKGTRLDQTKLWLRATQKSNDPKMIARVIASFMFIGFMHSKSFGLEVEERLGFYKKFFLLKLVPLLIYIPWKTLWSQVQCLIIQSKRVQMLAK